MGRPETLLVVLIVEAALGDGPVPGIADMGRAMSIYRRACALLWLTIGGTAWLL